MSLSKIFLGPEREKAVIPWSLKAFNFAVAFALVAFVFYFSFHQLASPLGWEPIAKYHSMYLQGWLTTIWISVISLVLSTFIGLFFALARRSRLLPLRYFSSIYIELVRGTPLLVQILIFFYVIAPAFQVENRYVVGILVLCFFEGAYIAEIIRIRISTSGRFYSNTNVSLRYFSAGTAPITASDGGSVRFVDQRFFVALHYCHQRIHTEREAGEFVHVQHAGKLHSARHWLPDPHAPDFTLVALAGETDEI